MVFEIKLKNKPLSIYSSGEDVYIGDFMGNLYLLKNGLKIIYVIDQPISSIVVDNGDIYYSTWKGEIYKNNEKIKIGDDIIKNINFYKNELYAFIGDYMIILENMKIKKKINLDSKVLCSMVNNDILYLGFSIPKICSYNNFEITDIETFHEAGILHLNYNDGLITSSADKSIRKNNNIIYKSDVWCRGTLNNLIWEDKRILKEGEVIIEHSDIIQGVVKVKDRIISIGLDCMIKIYKELDEELPDILAEL
ncbi:hypothetical protein SLOPH_1865 [Spraguea lophii 42_110]|uniref:Uncharacterized protein n=1 Tax=Spraguea lophii (strain 42_110) TaxID=1358809 RepID=S7W7V9_SPRLO|nr:hypothetical protein SLOPH_1865 [Spraguea lophii 42_110]